MVNNININKTNNNLSSQIIKHKKGIMAYGFRIPGLGLVQVPTCEGVKLVKGIQTSS